MQQRFDAIMASKPAVETPIPPERLAYEQRVLRCGIYEREIVHRKKSRKSLSHRAGVKDASTCKIDSKTRRPSGRRASGPPPRFRGGRCQLFSRSSPSGRASAPFFFR
jgi:hypothetical protein